jgi:hypothetical protein
MVLLISIHVFWGHLRDGVIEAMQPCVPGITHAAL